MLYSAAVITTTIHVQDFRDVVGDREAGRRTLPLVSEPLARLSVAATVLPWSIALARVWASEGIPAMIFVVLGGAVVTRFLLYRSVPDDKTSYKIYNVCFSFPDTRRYAEYIVLSLDLAHRREPPRWLLAIQVLQYLLD